MAFVLHPEVVRKAQAQLDVVVGRDRLPTFNDRMQLPYIEAIVKEVLRWRPSAPIGVPRRASQVRIRTVPVDLLNSDYVGRLVQRVFHPERRVFSRGRSLML